MNETIYQKIIKMIKKLQTFLFVVLLSMIPDVIRIFKLIDGRMQRVRMP